MGADMALWKVCIVMLALACIGWNAQAQTLPDGYWRFPLAPQGQAPQYWSDLEKSLSPDDCGACHAEQLAQWRTSLHARAFSPGLVGQLLTYDAEDTQSCLNCHAPLAEQAAAFQSARDRGLGHDRAAQGLASAGNSCGGCHVRGFHRSGPPVRPGQTALPPGDAPHGGASRLQAFERSEFCAACHQFPQDMAINGKPLENTVAEWQASPAASQGVHCQSCHMPDRKHLWRGIHDPQMVASGLTAKASSTRDSAVLEITNTGIGHAFPTYVTPKVWLKAVALDDRGLPMPGTIRETIIQRRVEFVGDAWVERFDTRLLPGQSASVHFPWPASGRVRVWLEIHPDDFYDNDVYDPLLRDSPKNSPSAKLIAQADAQAAANRYRLFEQELRR